MLDWTIKAVTWYAVWNLSEYAIGPQAFSWESVPKNDFLISQPKHMLWVLKRTVSMGRFFWVPKTYVKTDGLENIYNFTLKFFCLSKPIGPGQNTKNTIDPDQQMFCAKKMRKFFHPLV